MSLVPIYAPAIWAWSCRVLCAVVFAPVARSRQPSRYGEAGAGAVVLHSLFEEQITREDEALDQVLLRSSNASAKR